jgi:hypothetical protein
MSNKKLPRNLLCQIIIFFTHGQEAQAMERKSGRSLFGGRDDVLPAGVILLLLDHFKESANALFLYVDVSIS